MVSIKCHKRLLAAMLIRTQYKDYFEQVNRGPSTAHFIKTLNVSSLIHSLSRLILIESILWFCPLKGHHDYNAAFSKKKERKKNQQNWATRASFSLRNTERNHEIRTWTWTIGFFYLPHIFSVPYCTFNSKQPNSFNILFPALNWNRDAISLWLTWTLQSSQNLFALILK